MRAAFARRLHPKIDRFHQQLSSRPGAAFRKSWTSKLWFPKTSSPFEVLNLPAIGC